jgi:protein TonB
MIQIQTPHFNLEKLEPMALANRRPSAFLLSLCLHAVAGLILFATTKVSPVPFGVNKRGSPTYIEFAPLSQTVAPPAVPVAKPHVAPLARPTGDVSIPTQVAPPAPASEPTQAHPADSLQQFGSEDGTISKGDLGEAKGFKATSLERYLYELRVILANRKIYPSTSKRLGETGRVIVKFQIHRSGKIENLALEKPSDYSRLNEAALKLVSTVEKYKPFPADETSESLAVEVPIDYVLN